MKYRMVLDYTIPEGTLAPYFDALRRGEAFASACRACDHVAYPARALCATCGADGPGWRALPGTARVVHRTGQGGQGDAGFALVRFDGADTLATVALHNPASRAMTGTLMPADADRPGLRLKLDDTPRGESDV